MSWKCCLLIFVMKNFQHFLFFTKTPNRLETKSSRAKHTSFFLKVVFDEYLVLLTLGIVSHRTFEFVSQIFL